MESFIVPAQTEPTVGFVDSFLHKLPRDSRFSQSRIIPIYSANALTSNQDQLTFVIPKQTGGNTIHLANIIVEAGIKLTTASGNPPNNSETGGPGIVANILPSMFKEVRLIVNGTLLNPQCDNCQFVSYLSSTLSYGNDAKMSQKCMEGYYQDDLSGGVQSNDINNAGFMERRQRFLTKSIPQTYKAYPSIFMGQLQTGICFNEEGMLPDGCDVTIVFTQTTNEFRAFTSNETDDIVVTLVSLKLHVKISALMPELVNKLEEKMKRDNARLYAKRFTTTSSIIGKNSAIFCSDSLFSRHSNPQKIYVLFIEGDNFVGRRTKNPYNFSRKWPAASALTTVRTDGRREGANEPTSTAFIKSIRMTINGSPIDSLTTKGSEDDDEIAFARLQIFNTFLASPFTSGISYEDFMNGCYVWCADISTSLESNFDYLIPTVLDGMIRLEVEFSAPLGEELVMLTIGQHPSLIEIGRDRSISLSYPV